VPVSKSTKMLLLCLIVSGVQVAFTICLEEPTCVSRFDYDYKMLSKMVDLETQLKSLKENARNQIQLLMDRLDYLDQTDKTQQTQTAQLTGMCVYISSCFVLLYFWLNSIPL